jgi:hypothetical protein
VPSPANTVPTRDNFVSERHAADLSLAAAEALVVAHGRSLEAFGVGRAVDLALRGEPWTPRSVSAEMDWLIDAEVQRRAR